MRWWIVSALVLLASCKASDDAAPQVGSNSNWLIACDTAVDCSADVIPECACGVCTQPCASDDDCSAIDNARCALEASAAARSACGELASRGICLPRCEPGECGDGQACVNGACVLAALPDTELCTGLPASSAESRALEEELLALAETRRASSDMSCPGQPVSESHPALRLNPSLICTARALAADIAETRATSVEDSEGRDTETRLQLADYLPLLWADSFALEADSAEQALELMLQDNFNCMALVDADYQEIGIGVAGDVFVITLAAPLN